MSSILKALKRLEDESPVVEGGPAWIPPDGTLRPARGRMGRRWKATAAAGLLVLSAAAFVLSRWYLPPVAEKADRKAEALSASRPPSPHVRSDSAPVPKADSAASAPIVLNRSLTAGGLPTPPTAALAARTSVGPRTGEDDPPRKSTSRPPPSAAVKPAASPLDSVEEPPNLALQAIAWSEVPERRLAVIEGRVVREGAALRGFKVLRINRDGVVLSSGRASMQLLFPRDAASPRRP